MVIPPAGALRDLIAFTLYASFFLAASVAVASKTGEARKFSIGYATVTLGIVLLQHVLGIEYYSLMQSVTGALNSMYEPGAVGMVQLSQWNLGVGRLTFLVLVHLLGIAGGAMTIYSGKFDQVDDRS